MGRALGMYLGNYFAGIKVAKVRIYMNLWAVVNGLIEGWKEKKTEDRSLTKVRTDWNWRDWHSGVMVSYLDVLAGNSPSCYKAWVGLPGLMKT